MTEVNLGRIADSPLGGGRHEMNFVECCKNKKKAASDFSYAGPFNEMVVMGNLAVRLQSLERTLLWDSENMKVTNIGSDDKIRTTELLPYSSDVISKSVDDKSRKSIEWNALEKCDEWIKPTYLNGWTL